MTGYRLPTKSSAFFCRSAAAQASDEISGAELKWEVREPEPKNRVLGKPLHIQLAKTPQCGELVRVRVDYETSSRYVHDGRLRVLRA